MNRRAADLVRPGERLGDPVTGLVHQRATGRYTGKGRVYCGEAITRAFIRNRAMGRLGPLVAGGWRPCPGCVLAAFAGAVTSAIEPKSPRGRRRGNRRP